jgi:hypothetical protein
VPVLHGLEGVDVGLPDRDDEVVVV